MELKKEIEQFVADILKDSSFFVVDVVVSKRLDKVTVLLDGDQGVNIETCSTVSRQLGDWIDEGERITTAYNLMVSSAGADSPLTNGRQYAQHIGRNLEVLKQTGEVYKGRFVSFEQNATICLEVTTKEKGKKASSAVVQIPFDQVEKAKVIIGLK